MLYQKVLFFCAKPFCAKPSFAQKQAIDKQLNREKRVALATLFRAGFRPAQIARELAVHRSTVARELKRNQMKSGKYHAWNAQVQARQRRKNSKQASRLIENDSKLQRKIITRLQPLVSPEVVAHELGIHHQTIYSWIYRSRLDILNQLPQRNHKRRRYGSKRAQKQGWTKNVRTIHDREDSVISWEGDTIRGKGLARVLTHVERRSLYLQADLIPNGTADAVHERVKETKLTGVITYDRGSEFALWKMIERDTNTEVYFCDPHHPWQRGKNENTNGRLPRIYPKKFDFATIKQSQLDTVVELMNTTPRKSLGWRTPAQVFRELCCDSEAN